jgi:hypothetical protein
MNMGLKALLSAGLVATQVVIIVAACRARITTLMRLRFLHFGAEAFSGHFRQAGEEIRRKPEDMRGWVIFQVVLCTLPLDVLLYALWFL